MRSDLNEPCCFANAADGPEDEPASSEIHALDQPILDGKDMPNLAIGKNVALKVLHALESYVLPVFGKCQIARIERYAIESFFATQATKYSRSTIRSMRIALGLLLSLRSEERMAEGGFQQRSETAEC